MTMAFYSNEGVAQVFPLSMIGYAIFILSMIRQLKAEHANSDSIWHADDGNHIRNLDAIN